MNLVLVATTTGPDWAAQLTGIGTIALAGLGAFALVFTGIQLHQNRVSERKARADDYLARYNDIDKIPHIERMRKFISTKGSTPETRIAEWKAMTYAERLQTVHMLNFWEELAGRYNRNEVDQEIVRDYFGAGACLVWDDGKWFAKYQRAKNPRAMEQLEKMCADVRRRQQ